MHQEEKRVNILQQLQSIDVIEPVRHHILDGSYTLGEDGKIRVTARREADRPWMLFHPHYDRECLRWSSVYFDDYRIIPKGCRACWKVVHPIQDLASLFQIAEAMQGMGLEAKCGVDSRPHFGNLDQCVGFWYTPLHGGLRAGRALFKQVQEHLESLYKSKNFPLILKRGCTEMEAMMPSDQWDAHAAEFDQVEEMLDAVYEVERPSKDELDIMKPRIHKRWILRRAAVGDMTAQGFGARVRQTVTYHDSEHKITDYPGLGGLSLVKGVDDE